VLFHSKTIQNNFGKNYKTKRVKNTLRKVFLTLLLGRFYYSNAIFNPETIAVGCLRVQFSNTEPLRTALLALMYSAVEYCALVWLGSVY
jgi:hypothetical protein